MKKYSIDTGGIVEVICSALIILCMLLPWESVSLSIAGMLSETYPSVNVSMLDYTNDNPYMGAIIYGIIGLCVINFFFKFQCRCRWLSVLVVLAAGAVVFFTTFQRSDLQTQGINIEFIIGYHLTIVSILGMLIGILLPTDKEETPAEQPQAQPAAVADQVTVEGTPATPIKPVVEIEPKSKMQYTKYIIIFGVVVIAFVCFFLLNKKSADEVEPVPTTDSVAIVEEIACNAGDDEEYTINNYDVHDAGDGNFVLYAQYGEVFNDSGLDYTGNAGVEIYYKGDLDGDGNMDCILRWYNGGNCAECAGTDLVYYDRDKGFCKIKNISYSQMDDWKGKPSIVYYDGLTVHRFILDKGELKEVEKKSYNPGKVAHKFTRSELFPVADEDSDNLEVTYDLDGDGKNETLVFCHQISHANPLGETMYIENINWTSDIEPDEDNGLYPGNSFSILEHTTNDVHDILIDGNLYCWDGTRYWRMRYDGKELLWN